MLYPKLLHIVFKKRFFQAVNFPRGLYFISSTWLCFKCKYRARMRVHLDPIQYREGYLTLPWQSMPPPHHQSTPNCWCVYQGADKLSTPKCPGDFRSAQFPPLTWPTWITVIPLMPLFIHLDLPSFIYVVMLLSLTSTASTITPSFCNSTGP